MLESIRRKWYFILLGLVLLLGLAAAAVFFILGKWAQNTDIALGVDRSVSYRSQNDIENARKNYSQAKYAGIIKDQENLSENRVAIVFDRLSESSTNEKVLKVLKDHRAKATFSVPGIEAAENDDFLGRLPALGFEIAGSTLEEEDANRDSSSALIENLVMTKNLIEGLVDKKVDNVFMSGTAYSRNVCRAVAACGYKNVIEPSNENLIDERTFRNNEDIIKYVSTLEGDTIILIELEGLADAIKEEVPVYPDVPAIDKKSDTSAQQKEEAEEIPEIDEVLDMLLEALEERKIRVCSIEDFKAEKLDDIWLEEDIKKAEKAAVYRKVLTDKKQAGLAIYGLPQNLDELLEDMKKEDLRATFFITGKKAEKNREDLKKIRDAGHTIGNAGYVGSNMRGKSPTDCYEEICKGADALMDIEGSPVTGYMPSVDIKYEEDLKYDDIFGGWMDGIRTAANSNGSTVVFPVKHDDIKAGDIITVKCKRQKVDINELNTQLKAAKEAGLSILPADELIRGSGQIPKYSADEIRAFREKNAGNTATTIRTVPTTKKAVALEFYGLPGRAAVDDICKKLNSRSAKGTFFVTYQDLTQNPDQVEAILLGGQELGLAYRESQSYPQEFEVVARYIHSCREYMKWRYNTDSNLIMMPTGGAEKETSEAVSALGLTLVGYTFNFGPSKLSGMRETGVEEAAAGFEKVRVMMGASMLFRPDVYESDYIPESESENKAKTESKTETKTEAKTEPETKTKTESKTETKSEAESKTESQTEAKTETETKTKTESNTEPKTESENKAKAESKPESETTSTNDSKKPVAGDFVEAILKQQVDPIAYYRTGSDKCESGSEYDIISMSRMLSPEDMYEIPENENTVISLGNSIITDMKDDDERTDYIAERYVGNPSIQTTLEFPGFKQAEINKFDKKGRICDDKVIFLTFDDWGTDRSLNKLLYILDKHDVKATFFIKTEGIENNVNLLRRIALEGHEIGSHTRSHLSFAQPKSNGSSVFRDLTVSENQILRRDLVQSYNTLIEYAGDIEVDGKKAVSRNFRPPTLAVGRSGLYTVFDVGFNNVISGSFSSHDYEAESVEQLTNLLRKGRVEWNRYNRIGEGSVIVMHMTENAAYTAETLDIMIPEWKEEGYSFARVDEYIR